MPPSTWMQSWRWPWRRRCRWLRPPPRRSTTGRRPRRLWLPRRRRRRRRSAGHAGASRRRCALTAWKLPIGLAELLTHLRVFGGGVQRPSASPGRLGGQHRRGEVIESSAETPKRNSRGGLEMTPASGREKSVASKGSTVTPDPPRPPARRGRRPAAGAREPGAQHARRSVVPTPFRRPHVRSASRATLVSPAESACSTAESEITRVASAVVTTGPGTRHGPPRP